MNRPDVALPPGRYALAASGGADSTALAWLAREADVTLVHLNHELRGGESDGDERFVRDLARRLGKPIVVARRREIGPALADLPANPSARYRAMRLALYRRVVESHKLDGVLLAHHADDQAETVLLRLVRGGGLMTWRGMTPSASVQGVRIVRPLLSVRRDALRAYLQGIGESWREDASNASTAYRRNVVRAILAGETSLTPALVALSHRARDAVDRLDELAPALAERFGTGELALPAPLAEHAARRWLIARGAPADDVSPAACQRLVRQATDPTAPARQHYPGGLWVRRRQKWIFTDTPGNRSN